MAKTSNRSLLIRAILGLMLVTASLRADKPMALSYESESQVIDGIQSSWLALRGNGFEGRRYSSSHWILSDKPAPGASISFYHRLLPKMQMHFSVHPDRQIIGSLEDASIADYVKNLPASFKGVTIKLSNEGDYRPPLGSPPFMGRGYRKIAYTLIHPKTNEVLLGVCDFITVSETGLCYRLRFAGPPDDFQRMSAIFERELLLFTDNS